MVRLIVSGCNGKMGRMINLCVANRCDCEIVAGFDISTREDEYPIFTNVDDINVDPDVIVDF